MIWWVLIFGTLGSAGATAGSAAVMTLPKSTRRNVVPWLLAYATGTLLGAAFLGMIPKAFAEAPARDVAATLLAGIVAFFALEKLVIWRHCHEDRCEVHGAAGPLILIGDALHNFVDGVVIAAAFLISVPVGIATALAVVAHELPQEVGDFAILLESGYSPWKAFLLNGLSASATLPGAVIAYYWLVEALEALPYVLAASAASFIYIAAADLIPTLHRRASAAAALGQLALLAAGIATIALLTGGH
ncbi:ZIP family metal transporter [Desertibaculum subflavum]|uniref:ZIP family metal transporter n=1 Tax=Desertibaculum subflavum TaxID=2268458 RepID=UPI0034D21266